MPPRTAYSPGSITVPVRVKPARLRRWISSFMSMRWPGAMVLSERRMNSRGGRRCRMALTVVRTTVGSLRAAAARRASAAMRRGHDLGVGADAVVGHRVPGRERDDAHLGGEEGEALGNAPPAAGRRGRRAGAAAAALAPAAACCAEVAPAPAGTSPSGHAGQHLARWPAAVCERCCCGCRPSLAIRGKRAAARSGSANSPAGAISG